MSEVWHDRGCSRIGTVGEVRIVRVDDVWMLPCCEAPFAGRAEAVKPVLGFGDPCYLSEDRDPPSHVEHPRFAQADAEARAARLDGWMVSIYAIGDRPTREGVLESLVAQMRRTGDVP